MAEPRHTIVRAAGAVLAIAVLLGAGCAARDGVVRLEPAAAPERPKVPNPWFLAQRTDERGLMPIRARARAVEELRAENRLGEGVGTWAQVGPVNVGGRISALAVDPGNTDRIWLGAAEGGVFLSEDGGQSWLPVFDDQTALSIGSLVAHPTNSSIVYAGTGEDAGGGYSYDGEGVFRTTDGGAGWTYLGLGDVRRIPKMAIDPIDPDRVFAAAGGGLHHHDTNRGIYRSTDGGANWSQVLYVQDDAGGVDVAIDPANPSRVFAAIWQRSRADHASYFGGEASGLYRSIDGGDTWLELSGGLPTGADVGRIGVAVAPSNPQVVYADVIRASGQLDGVYRSTDGGDTWIRVSSAGLPGSFSSYGYFFGQIRVDPTDPDVVYVLDVNLWRSMDGGLNFSVIGSEMHVDHHALQIGPGQRLLAGNDGGFYRRLLEGSQFVHNATLPITQFYDLCVDPADSDRRFGGTQDNGTIRTVNAGLANWQNVLGGDGMECVIDPIDGSRVYAEYQWGNIFRSVNGGASFVPATSGINGSDRNNWVTPITHDPVTSGVLYTGTHRVYRSIDAAVSWSPISADLSNGPGHEPDVSLGPGGRPARDHGQDPIQGTVTAIGVSPQDTDILWAGTDDGNLWVSDDGGGAWTPVNPPGPAYWVTEITPDPFAPETAFATFSGYRLGDRLPYLRVTHDLGASWQDLSSGLPQLPLSSVAPDPMWRGRLFVAGDIGVHLSDDGGLSWTLLGDGMPFVVVLDLALDQASRTLFAGSHGRSLYAFDLSQLPIPDGDGDGVNNNLDCALADPDVASKPRQVANLQVGRGSLGEAQLVWTDQSGVSGPTTVYDVAVGGLETLAGAGTAAATDLECGLAGNTTSDPSVLPASQGVYYVVRAANACGTGEWGKNSQGVSRFVTACP